MLAAMPLTAALGCQCGPPRTLQSRLPNAPESVTGARTTEPRPDAREHRGPHHAPHTGAFRMSADPSVEGPAQRKTMESPTRSSLLATRPAITVRLGT
jgi:hypothetical protein